MSANNSVFIVDDDASFRDSLTALLEAAELNVSTFASAESFLEDIAPDDRGCLLLDVRMTGMSGLVLQEELDKRDICLPIIILSGHVDVPIAAKAMRAGAVDVIQKPFRSRELITRINEAIRLDGERQELRQRSAENAERLGELTERELQIAKMLATGQAIKSVAHELGLSPNTVQAHSSNILRKTGAKSVVELTIIVRESGIN